MGKATIRKLTVIVGAVLICFIAVYNLFVMHPHLEEQSIEIGSKLNGCENTTLLDLFYGMNKNSEGEYFDSVLDVIPGLIHREYKSIWYHPYDSVRYEMTLGIYMDDQYPSDAVKETIFKKLNTVIPEGFDYDTNEKQKSLLNRGVNPNTSVENFLNSWEVIFNKVSELNGYSEKYAQYPMVAGSRGCAVCHKVYEDSIWASYIVEMSVDYHISCGCPSSANYYTVSKQTGRILSVEEYFTEAERPGIEVEIRRKYEEEFKAKGYQGTPNDRNGNELMRRADGVAILNEGLLLYFHPYNIGCGAEGQYNLILSL